MREITILVAKLSIPSRLFLLRSLFCSLCFSGSLLVAHDLTIEEKKEALSGGVTLDPSDQMSPEEILERVLEIKNSLREIYHETQSTLAQQEAVFESTHEESLTRQQHLQRLYFKARLLKEQLDALQVIEPLPSRGGSAQWGNPEMTISDLITEYALGDALYLVPADIGKKRLQVYSSLSIPSEEWPELLSHLLAQQGVGIRRLSAYVKELYLIEEQLGYDLITNQVEQLWVLPEGMRVCFITDGLGTSVRELTATIHRFFTSSPITVTPFGSRVAIFASVQQLRQILRLQDYMSDRDHARSFKIVALNKLKSEDAAKMLEALFDHASSQSGSSSKSSGSISSKRSKKKSGQEPAGLVVIPIEYHQRAAFFLAGHPKDVQHAVETLGRLEQEIESSSGKRLFWYTCRHASPKEIGQLAGKVYQMLLHTEDRSSERKAAMQESEGLFQESSPFQVPGFLPGNIAPLSVDPGMDAPSIDTTKDQSSALVNDYVAIDPKSGSIMMVIEPHLIERMKELLARLDQPKKMVRIDFLLFEKLITDSKEFGLNLLKVGSDATNTSHTGATFRNTDAGIFSFFLSRPTTEHSQPFDLAYNFLLTQDNVQINANPSVITLNGTPSDVRLVDEISLSTGPVEFESGGSTQLKDSYSRAQFGIVINVTPQIHESASGQEDTITLDSKITFDTTSDSSDNRPKVTRRSIKNLVRIRDGETVILGGLRQKNQTDSDNKVPFLGEIPGFGKLFSYSKMQDTTTEMFIFITPRIINESGEDWDYMRRVLLEHRPGDSEIFLAKLAQSQRHRQQIGLVRSMEAIIGRSTKEQRRKASFPLHQPTVAPKDSRAYPGD